MLLEYVHDGRTAIITFNRPQAGNTVDDSAGRPLRRDHGRDRGESYRAVRHRDPGAGQDFCRGADLRERKAMDSEQWLRQRRAFEIGRSTRCVI